MKIRKDVKRDAAMVKAAMSGLIVPLAINLGMTMAELNQHGIWLRRQSSRYLNQVVAEVIRLESNNPTQKIKESMDG